MVIDAHIIRQMAHEAGFDLVGFAEASSLEHEAQALRGWVNNGYHAGMAYMGRNIDRKADPAQVLPEVKSVIVLGMNYYSGEHHTKDETTGKISRYAWGTDYHLIFETKMQELSKRISELENTWKAVSYVDYGPTMDKVWAVRAGFGWMGKHTNIINREFGSWFFIGTIFSNLPIYSNDQVVADHCGSCTACLDACPTGAFPAPYQLDANKCISYLTIEHKGEIPETFENQFEGWLFGCDICQEVCPWNKKFSKPSNEPLFFPRAGNAQLPLASVISMEENEFRQRFEGSPVKRTKLKGLQRNARHLMKENERQTDTAGLNPNRKK